MMPDMSIQCIYPSGGKEDLQIEPLPLSLEVVALLSECGLPVADLSPASPAQLFGVRLDGTLAAVVGLELYAPFGLLRSLAVTPACRRRGLARALTAFAESFAAAHGVESLFLLTTDAAEFFLKLGYSPLPREAAPPPIQATSQFSGLCPASSAFLSKDTSSVD